MPEGLEAELYRRAAERVVGRTIDAIGVDDRQPMARELRAELPGRRIVATRRIGKLVLLDLDGDHRSVPSTVALHFGMTGRLVVDGAAPIEELTYGSRRDDADWDRFVMRFADGGMLRVNDPRRWATFVLDPDETRFGPDFLSADAEWLLSVFARRRAAVKAVLLDQSVVAGYGNMCVDEVLWQAGVAPTVPARELACTTVRRLVEVARVHLPAMLRRGGSHRGTIDPTVRADLPPCPRDGAALRRDRVGGRTTVWCPIHQTRE